ncbi:unnamed protein product [Rotaria sp. Silwood1]|nr:unnamed protein product [Rotaria sp. Silwood1]
MKTTSSPTNLTELLSLASLIAASAASTLSSSAAMTDNNSNDLISSLSNYHSSTSISFIFNIKRKFTIASTMIGIYEKERIVSGGGGGGQWTKKNHLRELLYPGS